MKRWKKVDNTKSFKNYLQKTKSKPWIKGQEKYDMESGLNKSMSVYLVLWKKNFAYCLLCVSNRKYKLRIPYNCNFYLNLRVCSDYDTVIL